MASASHHARVDFVFAGVRYKAGDPFDGVGELKLPHAKIRMLENAGRIGLGGPSDRLLKRQQVRHAREAAALRRREAFKARRDSVDKDARTDGPTIEEYAANGSDPAGYPPAGYAVLDSPGLEEYERDGVISDATLRAGLTSLGTKRADAERQRFEEMQRGNERARNKNRATETEQKVSRRKTQEERDAVTANAGAQNPNTSNPSTLTPVNKIPDAPPVEGDAPDDVDADAPTEANTAPDAPAADTTVDANTTVDAADAPKAPAGKAGGPTLEQYMARVKNADPRKYPPEGYAEVESPALEHYRKTGKLPEGIAKK